MSYYKSKVLSIFDYKNVDLEPLCLPFEVDREKLDESLSFLQKKNTKTIEADDVKAGDIVMIDCTSSLDVPRYNKKGILIKVGRGVYDKVIEQEIIGAKVGDDINTSSKVAVRIVSSKRNVVPELSDEFAASLGLDGVNTLSELEQYFIEEQHKEDIIETVENVSSYVESIVVSKSTFEIDEEEKAQQEAIYEQIARQMQEMNGIDSESEEGKEGIAKLKEFLLGGFKAGVIADALISINNDAPTDEDYEKAIEEEMEYSSISREEAIAIIPRENYGKNFTQEYLLNKIKAHVHEFIVSKGY